MIPNTKTVELLVKASEVRRRLGEPVTCGIPWPRGVLTEVSGLVLSDAEGHSTPLQARPLDHWPDGSIRWLLLDWQARVDGETHYRLAITSEQVSPPSFNGVRISEQQGGLEIDTGAAQFEVREKGDFPFASINVHGKSALDVSSSGFTVEDESGHIFRPCLDRITVEEQGPLRVCLRLEGQLTESLAEFEARLHFFAGSSTVKFVLTLRNPRKAEHPGGIWELGNVGSIYLRDASITFRLPGQQPAEVDRTQIQFSPEIGSPFERCAVPLEIYQDSSGGDNWRSSNHLNRHRVVPHTFRGYRIRLGQSERFGQRATPLVSVSRGQHSLAVAMPYFWQNFPKAIEATNDALILRLFPRQFADVHEIQGGEQKTHTFYVAFGPDTVTDEPLAWGRVPSLAHASPQWYSDSGAIPYLTPKADDPNSEYLRLVDAAIEGDDTFEHKREIIDEYGWRHFGDIYGDHEAVFHPGPTPLVSHYNNQYDPIAGFAYQFCRSADLRWHRAMDELAWHVQDIDIYHTDRDKSAYNHGLFWHTVHYVDAGTATHRTYPRAPGVHGGGPGNEQNYATGLMLHYFLTGTASSRETAIGLAQWVIDMDDGRRTIFRWLDRSHTGIASQSRSESYHGPGRGSANSLASLLVGHQLTCDPAYLAKAEQLIRRVIHPADDVPARNLLDAENRWFYTMFLQSLGRYLDRKIELGQLDFAYAYAQASLLHYARWMANHEYPYLDKPEILEYPTETWPAQDMRKSEIFKYAAKHALGDERARFLERSEFFFRYVTTALSGMKTRTLCRPVVLLLSNGLLHAYFQKHPEETAPRSASKTSDFGKPEIFIPQKARAKKRFVILATTAAVVLGLVLVSALIYVMVS
jgi:hypothetical protein